MKSSLSRPAIPHRRSVLFLASAFLSITGRNAMTTQSPAATSKSSPPSRPSSLTSCAVVGVGVLGTSLCHQLVAQECCDSVTGITKTTSRHDQIRAQLAGGGIDLDESRFRLLTADDAKLQPRFDNVVFCAPPSGFEDYPAAVQEAAEKLWNRKGVFIFTSSGAVYVNRRSRYGSGDGEMTVSEVSPTGDASNARIGRMLQAEKACLDAGGCCLRLAGLYNLQRGAHNFWLTKGTVAGSSKGIVNLLHYDDAAAACAAALRAGPDATRGAVFLVSDGHPMTREEICASALKAKEYESFQMPEFVEGGEVAGLGKVYDGSQTNQRLQWKPNYQSFNAFMESHK